MEKTNPYDFIAIFISVVIVTAIMIILQLFFIDTWSNDHKFVLASISAFVGFLYSASVNFAQFCVEGL